MLKFVKMFRKDEKGATAIEYGLLAALIAVAAVAGMSTLGNGLANQFNNINNRLKG
jgi:pilus assembly protein Flp/PilA